MGFRGAFLICGALPRSVLLEDFARQRCHWLPWRSRETLWMELPPVPTCSPSPMKLLLKRPGTQSKKVLLTSTSPRARSPERVLRHTGAERSLTCRRTVSGCRIQTRFSAGLFEQPPRANNLPRALLIFPRRCVRSFIGAHEAAAQGTAGEDRGRQGAVAGGELALWRRRGGHHPRLGQGSSPRRAEPPSSQVSWGSYLFAVLGELRRDERHDAER